MKKLISVVMSAAFLMFGALLFSRKSFYPIWQDLEWAAADIEKMGGDGIHIGLQQRIFMPIKILLI